MLNNNNQESEEIVYFEFNYPKIFIKICAITYVTEIVPYVNAIYDLLSAIFLRIIELLILAKSGNSLAII